MPLERAPESPRAPCVQFLPGLEAEQAALAASGQYESWAFSGWDPTPEQLEYTRGIVAEAYDDPSSRAAEAWLAESRDVWLHSVEVAGLSVLVLAEMGASREDQITAARIAFWHDVGKQDEAVDAAIRGSDGLPPELRRIMERHPLISAQRAQAAGASDDVVVGALLHHRFIKIDDVLDRKPYPSGMELSKDFSSLVIERLLANHELATTVGVVAVADEFSALSIGGSARSYHEPVRTPKERLDIIERQLDQPFAHAVMSLVVQGNRAA